MITQLQKGKSYFYQISLAMLVAMISIVGCKKSESVAPAPTPIITSFKGTSGWVGNVVTITGTDFGADVASNIVKFGDKVAVINAATTTELKVVVPAGATTGKISVTVKGVTGTSTTDFIVNTETVYIAGYIYKNNKYVAGYWKNNNFVSLTDGTKDAFANAIVVVGNDVYVAGTEGDPMTSGKIAKYWKNGVATILSVQNAEVTGMTIVGTDIYVVGYEIGSTLNFVAKYWKNGVAVNLTDGTKNGYASALQVVGNNVYVVGYEISNSGNFYVAKYWLNGVAVNLSTVTSFAYSLSILGNDVYIAGSAYNTNNILVAKYWKNGVAITLGDGIKLGYVLSIKVIANDVYAIGLENSNAGGSTSTAKYWKNGVVVNLTDGTKEGRAFAMQIVGNDIHIVGTEGNIAKYWKNGVAVDYGETFTSLSQCGISSIVVIP